MIYRTLCAVGVALLLIATGACDKDEHGHAHGERADHSHEDDKAKPNPPTRTEIVPAAKASVPAKSGDAGAVTGAQITPLDAAPEAPAGEPAKTRDTRDEKRGHKHGDRKHRH